MATIIDNIMYSMKSTSQDIEISKALKQGKEFKKYQKNIKRETEIREGFSTQPTSYAEQSKQVLESTKLTNAEIANLNLLKTEYNKLINLVQDLQSGDISNIKQYIDITGPNNKYHNTNIRFTENGAIGRVTNKGDFKWYSDWNVVNNTAGKNGCPSLSVSNWQTQTTDINLPGTGYNVPGTIFNSTPPIKAGTPMQSGQSCGNEGNNVYVSNILPESTSASYIGCYTDNLAAPSMSFIGGSPQPQATIINGNFSQPAISNNSYQYITSQSKIPGWNFRGVLINNSVDWGYPMQYPNGNQCACIQTTQSMFQTLNIGTGTYTLSFFAVGRNCCDGSGKSNPVNITLNGTPFFSVQPPVNAWKSYSTTFNITTAGNNILGFVGTWTASDRSTAFQSIAISSGDAITNGTYTYDMCKEAAISGGYRYFSLQNVNLGTSKGYCGVTNNIVGATSLGTSYVVTGGIALWGVYNILGSTSAKLTGQGTLSVFNSTGASVFNSPVDNNKAPSNYLGCYGDGPNRAMHLYNGGSQKYNLQQCQQIAQQNDASYFGLQNSSSGTNAQCSFNSNLSQTRGYGKAGNCTTISDGSVSGGGWSNAVYQTSTPSSTFYLVLQDDGNMCIYRGSGPNDYQGSIWCTMTNGKQQKPNPTYTAAKSKFGRNYMMSGETLEVGEFIGSTNGSIYLIMQSDGSLVLYTSKDQINCSKMGTEFSNGNMGGGVAANALYDLGTTGFPTNVGKMGYVDDDGILSEYPSSMKGLSTSYTKLSNTDSDGNDIGLIQNSTPQACQSACNKNTNCYGVVFDNSNSNCYLKNNKMYPNGEKYILNKVDLYMRQPSVISSPGNTKTMATTDSVMWQNYVKSGKPVSIPTFTTGQKQELEQAKTRLNLLAQQITNKTNELLKKNLSVNQQMEVNKGNFNKNIKDYPIATKDRSADLQNISGIVNDSNIVVLKENYTYLMWSILAVGVVSLSLKVLKKD